MTKQEKREYRAVTKRDKVCIFCGSHITERHHIIHRSHGGITDRRNMVLLCNKHHREVHRDEKKWVPILLDRMRMHYGVINKEDLKKKGKYSNFAIPN
jgi:5-methylcytosine-specific restriction endonuclease McrA